MKDEGGLLNHDFIVEGSKPYRDQPAIYFLIHGGSFDGYYLDDEERAARVEHLRPKRKD
jgi:hypothetical protein